MRFLAVCSATRFWTRFTFSEDSSNNSEKKSKKFFQSCPTLNRRKISETPMGCTLYHPAQVPSN